MSDKFYINKFGVKILKEGTKAFRIFSIETINLEFLLIYILFSESSKEDLNDKKGFLKVLYENNGDDTLIEFLESEKSDMIFSAKSYEKYFGQMAYTRITDNVLSYFKDILVEVIQAKPQILKSKEKVALDYIFSFNNMEDLIDDITEKNIEKLFYGSINDIKKFFSDRLGIQLFENEIAEKNFEQFIKQRNLIVHNRGIISKEFAKDFSNEYVTYNPGNILVFSYENLSDINGAMTNLIVDLDLKISEKFKLETIKLD
ncbi:hypothetical protein K1F50_03240 [Muricauda oceani]|uniref:RiboL-PSP-HEPN domain-containing protein n=1 Tax=Flagellimonas oceani TaxID=2698672 RepID=A0A6G7J195_9FLAO|nr:hypothetical protein [Allomuricauda oceani]MBW8241800.1 hypothetical protein [Allomuricauda oceani]QII44222.1 hypothetical protein GVT53_05885 [Allomuricauda oceani]